MDCDREDEKYMKMALDLACLGKGFTNPNPMVGAVIVKDGIVIGKGYHHRCGESHAEVEAFKDAGDADVSGATMYVTLEPCSHYGRTPPCADKIIEKKIGRVVIGACDPNPLVAGKGIKKLKAAGIDVTTGVLEEESRRLNEIFMKYIVGKEPFVLYKSAMSLDGKIAAASGESQWISCEDSRSEVHQLRKQYMSIMVGSQTVINDDPMLTCRLPDGNGKNPVRIVVDSGLRIPEECNIVKTADEIPTIVVCTAKGAGNPNKTKLLKSRGVKILIADEKDGHVDLKKLVKRLGQEGIDSILIEGGATLASAAFESQIIDKVCMYIAPVIIGGAASPTPVGGRGILHLSDAWKLKDLEYRKCGCDICVTGYVCRNDE